MQENKHIFKIHYTNEEKLAFVFSCLFCCAIDKSELKKWCMSIIERNDMANIPPYIFDLADFDGELFQIYQVVGFVPSWEHTNSEDYALYGIAMLHGKKPYDMPVSAEDAQKCLEDNPHILKRFQQEFPFIKF